MSLVDLIAALRHPPEVLLRLRKVQGLYLVGGYLREAWLGRCAERAAETFINRDIDLTAAQPLKETLDAIGRVIGSAPFQLGERFASHRVMAGDFRIDISPRHLDGLAADLQRRDYTVNTLAVPLERLGERLSEADITAHPAAFDDLESRTLRMVSRENIADDPARILRGYRLAAGCGLTPETATRTAWRELATMAANAAPERLHEELLLWLGAEGGVAKSFDWCARDGVLWQLFPPLEATVGCIQNAYHHLDVWSHTLDALERLDELRRELPEELAPWAGELESAWAEPVSGAASAGALTRLAMLLHDIGKPAAREEVEGGHVAFHGHQEAGVELAAPLLAELKFANDEADFVLLLVREHLRLGFYCDHDPVPPRLVYRFIRRLGEATPLMLLHGIADCAATRGERSEGALAEHLRAAAQILGHYYAGDTVAAPPALLDGHAIMQLLGIKPGPLVGELKEGLLEATATGEVNTVQEARQFVEKLYESTRGDG